VTDEPGRGSDQAVDATRRTWLALERTQLAWWRTGLAALAVGIGVGRVVPELSNASEELPYALVGVAFAIYGVLLVSYGNSRERRMARELEAGRMRMGSSPFGRILAAYGVVLGVAVGLLIAFA
jgi:putative membrane protein